eukprot:g82077.t1
MLYWLGSLSGSLQIFFVFLARVAGYGRPGLARKSLRKEVFGVDQKRNHYWNPRQKYLAKAKNPPNANFPL